MNPKEQISKIKQRVKIFHIIVILLLILNAIVWFSTLIMYGKNDFVLFCVGLSCVSFLIIVIIVGILIERRIKRNLKEFVEKFAGAVSCEEKERANELLKKWKKLFISTSFKEGFKFSALTGKEKYPFGNHIVEDLVAVKKGIKVEIKAFYALIVNEDFGTEANSLLSDICCLIANNSYMINE